ncbi:hypothetical protein Hena1_02000 [Erwinia phage Hena1]|jgi:hypothetical protein|uniref:Uncharacterized protein n=1 Tax=Erwinia phage Hena1 TaxID=2678601 RepID=A0A6B9J5Q2_9CAUD|nr:hypothetical protein HWC84_gp164 [Erwinia phage Hena1]QGZ16350.1 hypothetical protein Hena1_02000 [Erwinia phage Hena1]
MSQRVELDFPYDHPEAGVVTVEAIYTVQAPDRAAKDSDWDYNGFQDMEYYAVFQNGKQICVDIPDDVLYHELRNKLRDVEISGCYSQERGEI